MNQSKSIYGKYYACIFLAFFILMSSITVNARERDVLERLKNSVDIQYLVDNAVINGAKVSVIQLLIDKNIDAATRELMDHFRPVNDVIIDHKEWLFRKINWISAGQSYLLIIAQTGEGKTHAVLTVLDLINHQFDSLSLRDIDDSTHFKKMLIKIERNYSKAMINFRDHSHIVGFGNPITLAGAYRTFVALLTEEGWVTIDDESKCLTNTAQYCYQSWTKNNENLKILHQHHLGQTFTLFHVE